MKRYLARPLYLLLLCGLVFLLLFLNGLMEFQRTEEGLLRILQGQGLAYLDGKEKEIKGINAYLSALKENPRTVNPPLPPPFGDLVTLDSAIGEHLMEVAFDLDRQEKEGLLNPARLSLLMQAEKLGRVEFWDMAGHLRLAVPEGLPDSSDRIRYQALLRGDKAILLDDFLHGTPLRPQYALGMKRRQGKGVLLLSLDGSQMQSLRLRGILESSRPSQYPGSSLRYLIFQGEDSFFLTPGEPFSLEGEAADPFLSEARKGSGPRTRTFKTPSGEKVYETVRSLPLGKGEPALLRAGLSLEETRTILSQLKASILLRLSLLIAFGIVAAFVVFWMQNWHFSRLREMEEKVQMAERLSSLGQLAAGLAHEIRNPLNAISMGIQRLKRESLRPPHSPEITELLEVIQGEIKRLDALVEKFLGLSRPDRICREKGDLGSIISELLELFAEEAKGKGIQLRASIPPDLPQLIMDRERMREAFLNLIKNGMESMSGGGVLQVEARRLDGRRLEVSFSDSGCGISASEQHKIFDPYFTSKEGGQGLGLSLTYQIIRTHGGEIRCESELRKGSRFFVILPYGEGGQLG